MKNILKGTGIKIVLSQGNIPPGNQIYLTILGEDGKVIINNTGQSLTNILLIYNATTTLYETPEITISGELQDQYIRLFFTSPTVTIEEKYYPEDARLIGSSVYAPEIVPLDYFLDYVLNSKSNIDANYRKAVQTYIDSNREGIRKQLQQAQHLLETKTKLYFTERTITDEKRDYFFDRFTMHLWFFQVLNPPINELVSFKIVYSNQPIADIDNSLFVVNREEGVIEFLPIPGGNSASLYTLLLSNLSGLALTVIHGNNLERIPALFRVTYKTGLIYPGCDEIEKESIRLAVCKQALIELLPKVDPGMRMSSSSESIDGGSKSKSFQIKEIIRTYKEEINDFAEDLRMKYGRNVDAVVV